VHEVSLVAELIEQCERRSAGRTVELVRVRHATTIAAETLQQAFRMLTEGGRLDGARLEADAFDVPIDCACGFSGVLGHDDLIGGSVAVCPSCGDVTTIHRTAELELLEVVTAS
jgi:Zn finger protein HypA/HybF involved in hydrogenase expression